MIEPITPQQARDHLLTFGPELGEVERRALRTLAAMRVEEDSGVVDPDTNGGRYETRKFERHVSEWREVKK